MPLSLLTTKLYCPPIRRDLVPRPQLFERLNAGLERKLVLVSAPAGFGKTTLLSSWISQAEIPAGWVSLDEQDSDPLRFLTYVVAAVQAGLQALAPSAGAAASSAAMAMLQSPQPPPTESILTILINELAAIPRDLLLVLDDYHLVHAPAVHQQLVFLLEHQPPQMHLVIATRSDPFFLPLSRLRARGQMVDIRADDLRFLPQESMAFLNQVMGLGLSDAQVATLENRTEGWIAGLRLAALSMRDGADVDRFISAFSGDDRYIGDYLVDEVLAQQPQAATDFLLKTSILDRMTGSLCDAVTGQEDGKRVLGELERANLFIVPLDNRRRWYRYHHLFADLLRQRLHESAPPQEIRSLHRCAGEWYRENDLLVEAVEHRLAAEDYEHVLDLIDEGTTELFARSQVNVLLRWQARLPPELVTSRPRSCMLFAWAWVATIRPKEAEHCLQTIEQTLGTGMDALFAQDGAKGMDPETRGALVEVAVVRAQLAIGRGDVAEALKLTRLVLPHLQDDEGPYLYNPPRESRLVVSFISGLIHRSNGDLDAAETALSNAAALGSELGNVQIVGAALGHLASVQAIRGRLHHAAQTCRRGLQLVQEMADRRSPLSGLLHVELGNLLFEQNELAPALHHFEQGIAVAKQWSHWDALLPGYAGLSRARAAQGDLDGALAALDELEALDQDNPQTVLTAVTTGVESFRARLWAMQGEPEQARRWAENSDLDPESEIYPFYEGMFITMARVLLAQKEWGQATRLIDRLLAATETGRRWRPVVELLALQAMALCAQGKRDEALEPLTRALALAEPEGYVRTFVDEGEQMAALLKRAASRGIAPDYVHRLLAAFEPAPRPGKPPAAPTLIEPLSEREIEVLRLLNSELSGPEIARELTIALPTLRFHTRNIYGKLGVHSRIQAVTRAEGLGLLF